MNTNTNNGQMSEVTELELTSVEGGIVRISFWDLIRTIFNPPAPMV